MAGRGCPSVDRRLNGGGSSSKAFKAMQNPFEFIQEVRKEAEKVTWPTRRETLITTAMVLIMVVIASVFFLAVDMILKQLVSLILGLSHG
jgi:preprotein translocase subunit SecE